MLIQLLTSVFLHRCLEDSPPTALAIIKSSESSSSDEKHRSSHLDDKRLRWASATNAVDTWFAMSRYDRYETKVS